jgi:hypothetical protein
MRVVLRVVIVDLSGQGFRIPPATEGIQISDGRQIFGE